MAFQTLATVTVDSGTLTVVLGNNANDYVVADAVRVSVPVAAPVAQVSDGGTAVANGGSGAFPAIAGVPMTQTFTVTNAGTLTLTLGSVSVSGTGFTLSSPPGSTSLAAGDSTTFVVQLSAAAVGNYTGTVSFATNDPNNNPFSFTLAGTVSTGVIVDNGQAGYSETGSWNSYAAGYDGSLRYTANSGSSTATATATWQLTGLPAGTYTVQSTWNTYANHATNAPYSIYDGNTLLTTVTVDQTQTPSGPTFGGVAFQTLATVTVDSGTLTVVLGNNANDYVVADAVRVSVPVAAPVAQVSDGGTAVANGGSVAFPAIAGVPMTQTFTVTNAGTLTLTLGSVSVSGTGFTLSSPPGSTSLAPGDSTTFVVQLSAAAVGNYTGTVSFATNDPNNNPFSFTLAGTVSTGVIVDNGQAGYSETGSWNSYAAGYDGSLRYTANSGSSTATATATWQLTGLPAGTYTVQSTWNTYANHATNATYSLYDGTTLLTTVTVDQTQTPSGPSFGGVNFQTLASVTVNSGTLSIVLGNNANGYVVADAVRVSVPVAAPVAQVSDGGTAVANGGSVAFPAIAGVPMTQTFTVTNAGTLTLTLGSVSVSGTGFTLSSPPGSTSLAPGDSTTFVVQLSAAAVGNYTGTVSFATNDPNNNPFSFTLAGTVSTGVIVDNGQAGYSETGSWNSYAAGYDGSLRYTASSGSSTATAAATWQVTGLTAGTYTVQATWNGYGNHATNAPYSIYDGNTLLTTVTVDQTQTPSGPTFGGVAFQTLVTVTVDSGTLSVVLTNEANAYVIADAIRISS